MVEKLRKLVGLGFSQQAIANGIGISKSTVSQWVNGTKSPNQANEERFNTWLLKFKETIAKI